MTKRRTPVTAGEVYDKLISDPFYKAREAERQMAQDRRGAEVRAALVPVEAELHALGFDFESLDQLRKSGTNYGTAGAELLLRWLPQIENEDAKESIVRALTFPWARPIAAKGLLAEFRKALPTAAGLKWAISNALEVVADNAVADEICELVEDKEHGRARQMLVLALGRLKSPCGRATLLRALSDDDIAGHAVIALGMLGDPETAVAVELFLNHEEAWIRAEARKALRRIGRRKNGKRRSEDSES